VGWRRWFSRAARDRERAEEIEAHLALYIDQLVARGRTPDAARREARLAFGNARARREELDAMNRLPVLDVFGRDLRYGLRVLRQSPAFALTAIATLALVIGANTAVFTLADAILVRPLPYPHPERLASIVTVQRWKGQSGIDDSQDGATWEAVRDGATAIDVALTASGFGNEVNLVVDNAAVSVSQARVSAGYFRVLGVAPWMGREFTADEDVVGGPAVAVLSYPLWQRVFRGNSAVIGHEILLRGEAYQVVGVMPASFQNPGEVADVWTPARPSRTGEGGGTNYGVIARVRDGHTWAEADGQLGSIGAAFFKSRGLREGQSAWLSLRPMQDELVSDVREPIEMLGAAVGVVLLIACVNLAALLLARGGSRTKEIATRMALGSGRGAVVRQLMVESALLGLAGGAVGLVIAHFGLEGLKALGGDTFHEWKGVVLNPRALGLMAGLSVLTSVLFGLVPALQATRFDINAALADSGSRSIAGGSRHWLRRILVASEVALGVVLLVVTGLLIRTFVNLRSLDPGFDPSHVQTVSVSLQDARYTTAARINQLFEASVAELAHTPGVQAAAVSLELPYKRLLNSGFRFADDSADPNNAHMANFTYVTPGFFDTFKIPVRVGRVFTDADRAGAPLVVVVNDQFVRSWANGANPVGRSIGSGKTQRKIVGVVGDVQVTNSGIGFPGRANGPHPLETTPLIFFPAAQTTDGFFQLVHTWFSPVWSVRTAPSVNVGAAVARAIGDTDPLLPLGEVRSMAAVQAAATARQRLLMILVGVLGAAAVLLSAIGIHGLIAHSVADRTREFGIRMALGATAGRTIRTVALSGVVLALVGAAAGGGFSILAVRLVESFLFGVTTHDPLTYVGVAAFLLVVSALASVLPALRILRLDPAETLRA
jgi:predicted permease